MLSWRWRLWLDHSPAPANIQAFKPRVIAVEPLFIKGSLSFRLQATENRRLLPSLCIVAHVHATKGWIEQISNAIISVEERTYI